MLIFIFDVFLCKVLLLTCYLGNTLKESFKFINKLLHIKNVYLEILETDSDLLLREAWEGKKARVGLSLASSQVVSWRTLEKFDGVSSLEVKSCNCCSLEQWGHAKIITTEVSPHLGIRRLTPGDNDGALEAEFQWLRLECLLTSFHLSPLTSLHDTPCTGSILQRNHSRL
jgi:hypothetical protein